MNRRNGLALLLAFASGGCSTVVRPSELRPALHPLLERSSHGPPLPLRATSYGALTPTDRDGELAGQRRALVARALRRLDGARTLEGRPVADLALVRAAFGPLRLDAAPERAATVSVLRRRARRREGPPRPADLVFLYGDGGPLRVGVVRRHRPNGVLEVALVTRGAVRTIRLDPRRPHLRRHHGEIINTFVRAKRRGDPAHTAYLAGERLESVRALLD